VVIFLELSVANFIVHADKYPSPSRAGNALFCNEFDFGRYPQKEWPNAAASRCLLKASVRHVLARPMGLAPKVAV
jgi:hypothetical protein